MDERGHAERRQRLHHRLEVRDRPRRPESSLIEQRLVVEDPGRVDAPRHGQRKRPRAGVSGAREVVSLGYLRQHVRELGLGAEVRQEPVADPPAHLLAVDGDQVDRFTRGDRGAPEPIPLGSATWERADVPLDARILPRESFADLSQSAFVAGVGQDRDRARHARCAIGHPRRRGRRCAVAWGHARLEQGDETAAGSHEGADLQDLPAVP